MKANIMVACGVAVASALIFNVNATLAEGAKKEKVKICHIDSDSGKGEVLTVSKSAVKAHLKHGDPKVFIAYRDGSFEVYVEEVRRLH